MLATFSPSSQISPVVGRSRQPIRFTSVDLPEPEGPMIETHSPGIDRERELVERLDIAAVALRPGPGTGG